MTADHHQPLHRWLSVATKKLPADAAQIVSTEIMGHFMDAVDDYVAEGLPQHEADMRALADLGAAETVGRGLKDVHLGKPHYKAAAAASMLILAFLVVFPAIIFQLFIGNSSAIQASQITIGVVLAGLTAYVLNTLRRLLIWRFAMFNLDKVFKVAIGSYLLWLVADTLSLIFFNTPLYIGSLRPLFAAASRFDRNLIAAAWVGQVGLGITGMMISMSLWQAQDNLYGIGKLFSVCLALMAVPIGLAGVAVNVGADTAVIILTLLVNVGHILIWPVITMLFIRAIFRPPNARPPQLA